MTDKTSFSTEEWASVLQLPGAAAMYIITASPAIGDSVNVAGMIQDSSVIAIGYDAQGSVTLCGGYQGADLPDRAAAWQSGVSGKTLLGGGDHPIAYGGSFADRTLYLAGTYAGAYTNAMYWKISYGSGAPTLVNVDLYAAAHGTKAEGVVAVGSNIYICGQDDISGTPSAAFWVNDASHKTLISGLKEAFGIWVIER